MSRRRSRIFASLPPHRQQAWLRVEAWVRARAEAYASLYASGSLPVWPEDITARILREMRETPSVAADYLVVVGGSGFERGNYVKAALNRTLGRIIKRTTDASVRLAPNGDPLMLPVEGEWHFTFTVLDAPPRFQVV